MQLDEFLKSQYDMAETICGFLDPLSISNLLRTNATCKKAIADFWTEPSLLIREEDDDWKSYHPITGQTQSVALAPAFSAHIHNYHPCSNRNKFLHFVDTGSHIFGLESREGYSVGCTKDKTTLFVGQTSHAKNGWMGGLPLDLLECPAPPMSALRRDVEQLYESFMLGTWQEHNLDSDANIIADNCFWADDLQVMIMHKGRKMWLVDPNQKRSVLVPDFLDVVKVNGRPQRSTVEIENYTYQHGRVYLVGRALILREARCVVHKKLFVFDLKTYVREWRNRTELSLQRAFCERVHRLVRMLEKYCSSIANMLHPHLLLNLTQISYASQMNIMMIITVINTGMVVDCGSHFECLGRVPQLQDTAQFDRFPASHMLLLRDRRSTDRHYLVSTKTPPALVATKSFRAARVKPNCVLPHMPDYCVEERA